MQTRYAALMVVGPTVMSLLVAGCGPSDGDAPSTDSGAKSASLHLTLVEQHEITTAGLDTVRPDVARTANRTHLGVTANAPTPRNAFDLLSLDDGLASVVSSRVITSDASGTGDVTATGVTTDMRIASDGADVLWCAFETATVNGDPGSTCRNCINFAAYRDSDAGLSLAANKEVECASTTCPQAGAMPTFPPGSIMSNDPAPFVHGGRYYILLHQYGASGLGYAPTPIQIVKVFDASFAELPSFKLDLGAVLGKSTPGTYSLVDIDGAPWVIGSAYDGPPCGSCLTPPGADGSASLFAVQLTSDLTSTAGDVVTLSKTQAYQHYVTGARYLDGKLYVAHNVEGNQPGDHPKGMLKVFDVQHGFALLEDLTINQSVAGMDGVGYNHITVEVMSGKVYAFSPTPTKIPENTVSVKVFAWQ